VKSESTVRLGCNPNRRAGNAEETECPGDESDDQKHYSVIKHVDLPRTVQVLLLHNAGLLYRL